MNASARNERRHLLGRTILGESSTFQSCFRIECPDLAFVNIFMKMPPKQNKGFYIFLLFAASALAEFHSVPRILDAEAALGQGEFFGLPSIYRLTKPG